MEDYKQKYEQALENIKKIKVANKSNKELVDFIEYKYPELKESIDGKIKKVIKQVLNESTTEKDEYYLDNGVTQQEVFAWLEKQGEQSHCNGEVNDEALQKQLQIWFDKGKCSGRDEVIFHPENFGLQKQGEQKPQGKLALEVWKDMRLEVYQQASGNRHEPNYSDDSTKMFSLTDIDEIFEKVAEKQGEQKANKIHPIFRVGDYIRNKKTSDKVLIEQLNVKSKAYCYTSYDGSAEIHSDFPFSKQDEWELIGQQIVEQKSDDSPKWKELTWQDINTLEGIINNVHYEFRNGIGEEGFGKEVLERFREIKGDEYMDTCEQKLADKIEPKWKKGHDGEFLYENSVVWIHNETKTLATAGLRLDSNTFYIPISELEKLPKEEFEKQGEHKCDCKYVGCHVNDVKRWCHKKQAEILYEKCNIECSEYLKQDEQKPTDKVEPKFHEGDKLVSTKNPRLTYKVLEIGNINELGNPEYKVEIFTDGKAKNPRNIHYMECYKVEEWAKLIEQKPTWSEEDKARYYGVLETEQYMLDVVNGIKKFDVGNEQIKEECTKELAWLKSLKERMKGE